MSTIHTHRLFRFLLNRKLNEVYFAVAMRSLSGSMLGIFIPIYIATNYSIPKVFIFYGIVALFHASFSIISAKISTKIGMKHTITLAIPLSILGFLLLYKPIIPVEIIGAIFGISNSLFWTGYHIDFSKISKKGYIGKEIGLKNIISSLASAAGPLIGGTILAFFGFHVLFIIVSILLFLSIPILLASGEIYEKTKFSLKNVFKHSNVKEFIGYSTYGIESSIKAVIWPLFVFLFIIEKNYIDLGIIGTASLLLTLIFTYIVGTFTDKKPKTILNLGAISSSIIWAVKMFVSTFSHIVFIDSLHGLVRTMIDVPIDSLTYERAKKKSATEYIVFREIGIHGGRFIFFSFLFLFVNSVKIFAIGTGFSLLYLLF